MLIGTRSLCQAPLFCRESKTINAIYQLLLRYHLLLQGSTYVELYHELQKRFLIVIFIVVFNFFNGNLSLTKSFELINDSGSHLSRLCCLLRWIEIREPLKTKRIKLNQVGNRCRNLVYQV